MKKITCSTCPLPWEEEGENEQVVYSHSHLYLPMESSRRIYNNLMKAFSWGGGHKSWNGVNGDKREGSRRQFLRLFFKVFYFETISTGQQRCKKVPPTGIFDSDPSKW